MPSVDRNGLVALKSKFSWSFLEATPKYIWNSYPTDMSELQEFDNSQSFGDARREPTHLCYVMPQSHCAESTAERGRM